MLAILIAFSILTIIIVSSAKNIFRIEEPGGDRDYLIYSDPATVSFDSHTAAKEAISNAIFTQSVRT